MFLGASLNKKKDCMAIEFELPNNDASIIKVIGVGGGGCNAVNYMFEEGIEGVDFLIANTDAQALEVSQVATQIQLGPALTEGNGAGAVPEVGKNATLESLEEIKKECGTECKMAFITAGMGGGTGTGGAPIIAKALKEAGMLTVGIVTFPFAWEGPRRIRQAQDGIEELKKYVDSLIVISNDKLREIHGNLDLKEAFAKADDILTTAAKGIAEIITVPGTINVDFEDVSTVMRNSGVAIMGSAVAQGEDRALQAARAALSSPLLDNNDISGAKNILLNITYGNNAVKMDEIGEITGFIRQAAGPQTDIIWGTCLDESKDDELMVTVVATGFEADSPHNATPMKEPEKIFHELEVEQKVEAVVEPVNTEAKITAEEQEEIVEDTNSEVVYSMEPVLISSDGAEAKQEEVQLNGVNDGIEFEVTKVSSNEPEIVKPVAPINSVSPDLEISDDEMERMKVAMKRRKQLQNLSASFASTKGLTEMEREPAYKRKNVDLDAVPNPTDTNVSRYTLTEDEKKK